MNYLANHNQPKTYNYEKIINEEYQILDHLEKELISKQSIDTEELKKEYLVEKKELEALEEKLTNIYLEIYKFGSNDKSNRKNFLLKKIEEIDNILASSEMNTKSKHDPFPNEKMERAVVFNRVDSSKLSKMRKELNQEEIKFTKLSTDLESEIHFETKKVRLYKKKIIRNKKLNSVTQSKILNAENELKTFVEQRQKIIDKQKKKVLALRESFEKAKSESTNQGTQELLDKSVHNELSSRRIFFLKTRRDYYKSVLERERSFDHLFPHQKRPNDFSELEKKIEEKRQRLATIDQIIHSQKNIDEELENIKKQKSEIDEINLINYNLKEYQDRIKSIQEEVGVIKFAEAQRQERLGQNTTEDDDNQILNQEIEDRLNSLNLDSLIPDECLISQVEEIPSL